MNTENEPGRHSSTIIYISYDGMTDQLGQSQVLPYIIGLSNHNYRFHLISCEKPEKFEKSKDIIQSICSENNIVWHPLKYRKSPPVLSTILDVRDIFREVRKICKISSVSMIHCRGYISALVGLRMKRSADIPFLFDMRGLWADEKVDAGTWNLANPVFRIVFNYFKRKEKSFFEEAAFTISLTYAGMKEIHSWTNLSNNPVRIKVIPCCADLRLFDRDAVNRSAATAIRRELGISPGAHVLGYLGSIGGWYMLDEMLDFFIIYLKQYPNATFFFISLDQHDLIRKTAFAKGISHDKVVIRGAARSEVADSLSLCTHSVFFIRPTYSKISSSPTKQAELMGMGIPVICNYGVGDTGIIVNKYESGIAISDFSESEYMRATTEISMTKFDEGKIRRGAMEYFSLVDGVNAYLTVYQQVIR